MADKYDDEKIEKTPSSLHSYVTGNIVDDDLENNVQKGTHRGLDARHIQMISLGGAIGYIYISQ